MIKIVNKYPIHQVLVYKGHVQNPLLGPYSYNIVKRIKMFNELNKYREEIQRPAWNVTTVAGEHLIDTLTTHNPQETLLVIPAGQSTNLDKVFSDDQIAMVKNFFNEGGRGYLTCGSAYWASKKRVYKDLCTEQPEHANTIIKTSRLPLFQGVAEGPLCPYPGKKYQVGFLSDAVKVTDGKDFCTIYLSGGGSFLLNQCTQKVKVLVKYLPNELIQRGKQDWQQWQNAVIMAPIGQGGVLLSMFHPYYGPNDIDVELYEKHFPQSECGTNWRKVKESLSPIDVRMQFVLKSMLNPLEDKDF